MNRPTLVPVTNPFPFLSASQIRRRQSHSAAPPSLNVALAGPKGRPSSAAADDRDSSPTSCSCSCGNPSVGRRRGRRRPSSRGISRSSAYLAGRLRGPAWLLLLPFFGGKVRREPGRPVSSMATAAPRQMVGVRRLSERLHKGTRAATWTCSARSSSIPISSSSSPTMTKGRFCFFSRHSVSCSKMYL
jgi:hypothetical protein